MMKIPLICLLCLVVAGPVPGAEDRPTTNSVATLETLVAEWARLRLQGTEEKRDWKEKEAAWRAELDLLKNEAQSLQRTVDELTQTRGSAQKSQADLLAKKEKMEVALAALAPILDRAEAQLRTLARSIPAPLFAALDKVLREIPSTPAEAARVPATRRLQLVVALYSQIEDLQHNIHVTKEALTLEKNETREMDVLYLGLACGFAVSADNQVAALGTPTPDGWAWSPDNRLADEIRRAIAVFNRERVAQLVTLPLKAAPRTDPAHRN